MIKKRIEAKVRKDLKGDEYTEAEILFLTEMITRRLCSSDCNMYVLTSKDSIFGAISMFYPNGLKELAKELGSDLYILPSSIHDVIVLPAQEEIDADMLKDMVHRVNKDYVDVEELLSDSVYYYKKESDSLSIAL